jgi:anaerobic selenocysteine-containing dehydrogenase
MVGEKVLHKAKFVTFDPRCSQTAGKSDEWFPIKPGTDGIVALAMANIIMKEGLYDRNFIDNWCNYPLDKLMKHLAQYTPQIAEEVSGIKSSDIRRIAREFATTKPATTISSGGVTKHLNGVSNERCIALLSAITGNIDTKGGNCFPRTYQFEEPEPKPPEPQIKSELWHPNEFPLGSHHLSNKVLSMKKDGRQRISVYMIYEHNPAYSDPQCNNSSKILKDKRLIPYFVAISSYMTESAALADIILPAATYLERLELESPPSLEMVPFVTIRQPIVEPIGEAKPFMDILIKLAKKIGGGMEKYFTFSNSEEYWEASIRNIYGLVKAGGLEYLKRHGVWYDKKEIPKYKTYEKKGFKTPSSKFEIYSKRLEDNGFAPLYIYTPIYHHMNKEEDEFILIIYQPNVHTHGDTANSILLSEITHTNRIWINSDKAKAIGIQKGDIIEITSQVGSIKAEVHTTAGINPQVLAISDSCGHWEYGSVAQAKKFKSKDPFTMHIWWEEEGNGIHPNSIITNASDPIGGGQAWMDTKVRITKVEKSHVEKSIIEKIFF